MVPEAQVGLESRIRTLEVSARRAHRLAAALGALLLLALLGAWRADDKVETRTLVLTDTAGLPAAVLRAGPVDGNHGASLILESPDGVQVLRLGGPVVRPLAR